MDRKKLNMRPVTGKYMEQYNALLRYVFQVTEQELTSIGWEEKEIIRAKFPTMEKSGCAGMVRQGQPGFPGGGIPHAGADFGRTYRMGGLTGVGTYPEYSTWA